jgi:hypothetical protein
MCHNSQAMNRIIVAFFICPIIDKILLVNCPLLVNKLERLQNGKQQRRLLRSAPALLQSMHMQEQNVFLETL